MIVAIDGTVCSGKSTVASRLAKKLGFMHLNTGTIYRALTIKVVRAFGEDADYDSIEDDIIDLIKDTKIDMYYTNAGEFVITLDGENVASEVGLPYVSQRVSVVAKYPRLREFVVDVQRELAGEHDIVIEGRDIGTVVFPNAEVKFYMSADDNVRACRRQEDYRKKGKEVPLCEVLEEIKQRDKNDIERECSPLKPAEDSIMIDNSGSDADAMVDYLAQIVKERMSK